MIAGAVRWWLALTLSTAVTVLPAASRTRLDLSVAISLAPAVREAIAVTMPDAPPHRIHAAASGVLLQQIRHGAPADLLIAASSLEVDSLIDAGLADPATRVVLASNRLTLISARGDGPATLAALSDGRIATLAVANPRTAPLGRYTRSWIEHEGLDRDAPFRLIVAESARHTLEYAARGEVDAAVVYASDARRLDERLTPGEAIDPATHPRIDYVGIVLERSSHPEAAHALLKRLAGERGRRAFEAAGFVAR